MVFKIRTLSLPIPRTKEDLLVIHGCPLKTFSLRDLKLATDNFSNKNIVGRGGFGKVYKGRLADGSLVTVKRLKEERTQGGLLQFQTEVEVGGSPASNHRNVLRLLGYCMTRKERILVFPFIANRSLSSRLRERDPSETPLDWSTRKRIALGAAKGLAHFHNGSSFMVIHRDIKAANILLDEQFDAILCDFGLAKFVGRDGNEATSAWVQRPREEHYDDEDIFEEEDESDQENNCFTKSCWNFTRAEDGESGSRVHTRWSCWAFTKNGVISESSLVENGQVAQPTYHDFCSHVTTAVRGTIGHIAPEYLATGKCSFKTDVFGYGVMLLELVTGQRTFDLARLANDDDVMLLDWVKGLLEDQKLDLLVDSDIRGDYIQEELEQLIQLALSCTQGDPEERPVMTEAIKIIENIGKPPRADQLLGDLSLQSFSLQQLKLATHDFNNKNIMGKSGYGSVYKGLLKDGSAVVVKRLVKTSKRGKMQFQADMKLGAIISMKHPNLQRLRGYCISGNERLLVYPFMSNRSLEWRLRPERSLALDWRVRKQIAFGVAKGIAHLHYDCDPNVNIRRDVKLSNILLDSNFNPVISNLRLQPNDSSLVDAAVNDVYGYGITLFVLISGKVSISLNDPDNRRTESGLHDMFKKLRHHQLELLVDPRLNVCDSTYDTMHIKDEVDLLIQVALLCTQPSLTDRPEMWEVMQMLQGISEGDLKTCFPFDRANLFRFDESLQPQPFHELELGAMMDLPKLDTEGSISTEPDQTSSSHLPVSPKQESGASSKGKETATFSEKPVYSSKAQHTKLRPESKGITISDNVREPKMQERWETFLSEVVTDAMPTHSKLFQSRKSVDLLCPLCNEYEEDNFHLFFKCDFSRQAWLLAAGVRIDMLVFGSMKEAMDVILKPNDAAFNILPPDVEPSRFTHKAVALMHAIWTHRNQVCFNNTSPNVIQMLVDHPDASELCGSQPPPATELTLKSPTQTQEQFQVGSEAHATGWATFDTYGCVRVASESSDGVQFESSHDIEDAEPRLEQVVSESTNWVQFESSHELEEVQPQLEEAVLQEVTEPVISNERHDCPGKPEATVEAAGCMGVASCAKCESGHETDPAQLQPKALVLPQVLEPGSNNNNIRHDFQLNILTSGGFSLSLKFNYLSVWYVVLVISLCMNLVSMWLWAKPRY